jgi:hypothetical protein
MFFETEKHGWYAIEKFQEMTDLRWLELPIARTHFDSPFEFEPTKFYCILFAKYNKLGSDTIIYNIY